MTLWTYNAKVISVTDGDTIKVDIDVGFGTTRHETVRLLAASGGVDAPEVRGITKVAGLAAKERVRSLVLGRQVTIRTEMYKQDGFRRYLAQVTMPDGRDLGDLLLAEGYATVWKG